MDSILLATVFYYRNGITNPGQQICFMGSENLFQPGFLGTWIRSPKFIEKLLRPLSLDRILRSLNAYPIGKLDFDSIPLHEALQIIKKQDGNYRIVDLFQQPEKVQRLFRGNLKLSSDITIGQYFEKEGYPRRRISIKSLKPKFRKLLKRHKLGTVKQQLGTFINLLDEGKVLYITPEGQLSTNGLLGPLKDSLLILIDETEASITVTPTNITYDFITEGKPTIFVNVGQEMEELSRVDRKKKSEKIRQAILGLTTVTLSQIASRNLILQLKNGNKSISADEFEKNVRTDFRKIREQHSHYDKRLEDPHEFLELLEKFCAYCVDKGIISRRNSNTFTIDPKLGKNSSARDRLGLGREIGYKKEPIKYCANELAALKKIGIINL